jgi:phage terminase large subunit-like protein
VSRRKPVEELKKSGTWRFMTKAEQARRLAQEAPLCFEFGAPPIPDGLSPREHKLWRYYCEGLLSKRVLAKTDGSLILQFIQAKSLGDDARISELVNVWRAREPFPEISEAAPTLTPPVGPTIPDAVLFAKAYALDVTTGAIGAGELLKLACQRFLDDLKRTDIVFDPVAAQHVVSYVTILGLTLLPWQIFMLTNVFGWKRPDGLRRFRNAYIEIAKKNGKTALSAAIALYCADTVGGDGEENANVYCAATTKYQSQSLCFKAAVQLRNKTESLAERTRVWKSRSAIVFTDAADSSFEPLAANSDKLNGLNIAAGILDELGDHPDSSLYNVFTSSTVGRKQPLIISITTAGNHREQIAWEVRNRACQVLESVSPDDAFFAYICELDEGDDWQDEAVWIKANPSLGSHFLQPDGIREEVRQALTIPSNKRSCLRFHMNIWPTSSLAGWINFEDLAAQGNAYLADADATLSPVQRITAAEQRLSHVVTKAKVDLSKLDNTALAALSGNRGRPCFGGLDLALVNDLSALCLLFPPEKADGVYECLFRFWCPEENIARRTREQRVPYEAWRDSSHIIATPGEVTSFEHIRGEILALREKYRITELGFDKALAADLVGGLENAGMKVLQISQGFALSPAILRVERLVVEHKLCTFGHPVANWCFSNVLLAQGFKGDCRVEKAKAREKIDGAVAAIIAMQTALLQPVRSTDLDAFKVRYL